VPTPRTFIVSALAGVIALVVTVSWGHFLLPKSLPEYQFRTRLSDIATSRSPRVSLASLYPSSEWELACESNGYDGDLYLKKYNRTYPPAAPPNDTVWGLIFIQPDGSYTPVAGSCSRGGAMVRLRGCASRSATFALRVRGGACPEYLSDG
jgi:hypothetical protein